MIERNFVANSVAAEFLSTNNQNVELLMGPVGCGKSSGAMIKLYLDAVKNSLPGHDGIRRTKTVVTRNTYSQLETTTIKTWGKWFPVESFGKISGDSPMTHTIRMPGIEWDIIFLAVNSLDDLERLKSLEVTNAYVNEAQFIGDKKVIENILERTNRYPDKMYGGGLGMPKLYMDCNPPSQRHWIYSTFEKGSVQGWKIYKYEPALIEVESTDSEDYAIDRDGKKWVNNPTCDYRQQQNDSNYWLHLARGASREYILVNLCGQYGVITEGLPVHPEYNDTLHRSSSPLQANPLVEIGLGFDFGLTPACAVTQLLPSGQFVVLAEIRSDRSDFQGFLENEVIPFLDRHYPWWRKNYVSVHDPADSVGNQGNTNQNIMRSAGINSYPATTNAMAFRRASLKYFLTRAPNGNPGFLLNSQHVEMLREGLMGEFKYPLIKYTALSGDKQFQEKPLKNMWSHICEALEYIASNYARVAKEHFTDEANNAYTINTGSWMSF